MDDDTNDRIRTRAYAIWEAEGRPEGGHHDHWSRAEQEMVEATDPLTAAILPQATLLEPDVAAPARKTSATKRAKKD